MTASESVAETEASGGQATESGADAVTGDPAVVVDGLRKTFGRGPKAVTAVDGVSLAVERGSVVGLLGPNGAGKTTLIKSILGMIVPDEGDVYIGGVDARASPRAAYVDVDAMLEGARNDYWRLTVRENLRYFATVSGVDPDSVAARHDRLLERLDLAGKADTAVRDLSRGMKQKVSLASVLAGGASVLFLDEPTLGLDVGSSRTLQRELRRLVEEEDLTVILSSHDMDVVERVCDRVVIVSEGRVVADDTVDALSGTDDSHRLELTSADFDDALLSTLSERAAVVGTESLERGGCVEVRTDSDGLYALLAVLDEHGVTLDRVQSVERDLETAFVDLTGMDGPDR
ncbi:ABC transporter ATP-binding protein [Halobacteriales archaeon QH_8_67_36]|nr:MAG: ABC transporter ATP-binding protein [Halobacteriales archaeon QH_8_67_36]